MSEPVVEIRHNGFGQWLTVLSGLGLAAFGGFLGWICTREPDMAPVWVVAGLLLLGGLGFVGYGAYQILDHSVRLTLTAEGLARRGKPTIPWAAIRRVRLLISKPGYVVLEAVLELAVERDGVVKPVGINLMELDHDPEKIADLVRARVNPVWLRDEPGTGAG